MSAAEGPSVFSRVRWLHVSADMTGRESRPGGHQRHSDCRDRALLLNVVTRSNRFDDLDVGLVVGLG